MKKYTTEVKPLAKTWEHSFVRSGIQSMTEQGWDLLSTYVDGDVVVGVFQSWEKVRR